MTTSTDKTFNGLPISYHIADDGYTIYLDGNAWIEQYGDYSKPIDPNKTIEENCLAQIEQITFVPEHDEFNTYNVPDDIYHAIVDDTIMALMDDGTIS